SADGSVPSSEVINYYQLQASSSKVHLLSSSLVTFNIDTVPGGDPSYTPTQFGVGGQGKVLVYTNGASIFSVSLDQGYKYQVDLVPLSSYQPQVDPNDSTGDFDEITSLSLDPSTDIITIGISGRSAGQNFSQLYFYKLNEDAGSAFGTLDLLKLVDKGQFPAGTSMTPGSNAVVSPDARFGFFALDDGSLCDVRLAGDITEPRIAVLGTYSSMIAADPMNRGARLVQYDGATNSLAVVKKGTVLHVRRPAYSHGSPGVRRPAYISETPALVLARLSADDSGIAASSELNSFGSGEQEISNIVFDGSGGGLLTTGSGSVLSVNQSGAQVLGGAVPRIGELVSGSAGAALVGLSSYDVDQNGNIVDPGSLVIMSMSQTSEATRRAAFVSNSQVLSDHSVGAGAAGHIRRPCSIQR
ncbi:MAG TPA: hypothetical protein VEZ90_06530, partial [Blastocatellia bacterium]|nr:hypothetical protein [Blastocatellia bacterium]